MPWCTSLTGHRGMIAGMARLDNPLHRWLALGSPPTGEGRRLAPEWRRSQRRAHGLGAAARLGRTFRGPQWRSQTRSGRPRACRHDLAGSSGRVLGQGVLRAVDDCRYSEAAAVDRIGSISRGPVASPSTLLTIRRTRRHLGVTRRKARIPKWARLVTGPTRSRPWLSRSRLSPRPTVLRWTVPGRGGDLAHPR